MQNFGLWCVILYRLLLPTVIIQLLYGQFDLGYLLGHILVILAYLIDQGLIKHRLLCTFLKLELKTWGVVNILLGFALDSEAVVSLDRDALRIMDILVIWLVHIRLVGVVPLLLETRADVLVLSKFLLELVHLLLLLAVEELAHKVLV